jgi:hypothetical protein
MSDTQNVQWLRDRIEIEQLAFLFAKGNDLNADYYAQCMLDDVEVEYPFGKWKGLATQKRIRDGTIGVCFTFTQHDISNPTIEINGDAGRAQYNVFASHGLATAAGQKVVYAGAVYTQDVVRTPKGWRIKRHHCAMSWADDDGGLMGAVGATFQKALA